MRYAFRRPTGLLFFVLLITGSIAHARSRSYFVPRSITHNSVYELALRNYKTYWPGSADEYGRAGVQFFASPFYTQSVKEQDLGRYFTPYNKNPFVAAGSYDLGAMTASGNGNVSSYGFSIVNPGEGDGGSCQLPGDPFRSLVNFRPRRSAYGVHFGFRSDLSLFCDNYWFHVDFAAMGVRHDLKVCEVDVRNPGNTIAEDSTPPDPATDKSRFRNMTEALRNPDWCYGRVATCTLRKAGVDDIQLKLGYDWAPSCPFDHFSLYLLGTIPTGSRQCSKYLFEPVVGSKHGALGAGMNIAYRFFECRDSSLTAMVDIKYRYIFPTTQRRSFDMIGRGDWSRYLNLAPRGGNDVIFEPGINILTVNARVRPRSVLDAWAAIHYQNRCWHAEAGYDFWYRVREQVKDPCRFQERYGFHNSDTVIMKDAKDNLAIARDVPTQRCRYDWVQNSNVSDATLHIVTVDDLDLCSVGHPRAYSHTIYGLVAHDNQVCEKPVTVSLAGSYEIAQDKRYALEQWAVWGTIGVAF